MARPDPADFRWAVKASRFLTHIKRLREPEEPVARLMGRAEGLGAKLDTILLQLPPTLKADAELLRECLAQFPAGTRVAVEPRHAVVVDRRDPCAARALRGGAVLGRPRRAAGRAPVAHRRLGLPALPPRVRGLGLPRRDPRSCGPSASSSTYGDADVLVYFNNDPGCNAVIDAVRFADSVRRAGGTPTRVPTADQATGPAWTA